MDKLLGSAKAIVAGVVPIVSAVSIAIADKAVSLTEAQTILALVLAVLAQVAAVWKVPNKPKRPVFASEVKDG